MRGLPAFLVFLCIALPAGAAQDDIREVVVVGPSWEGFTGRDGTGLYHDILKEVFALYDIKVVRQYVPSERAYDLVREGLADFMTCHDRAEEPLRLARHAMYENQFHVFFKKSNVPDWQGAESLLGRVVVWRIGYYDVDNFSVPLHGKEVKSGPAALGMVVLERADFYVDDELFIRQSMLEATVPFDPEEYRIEAVGRRQYKPVFSDSERAAEVMALYDRGIEELYRRGELQAIFEKWGQTLPQYDFSVEEAQPGKTAASAPAGEAP